MFVTPILLIFSNNQLLVLLIFAIVSFVSFSLISALILMISFLLLTLGFFISSLSSCFRSQFSSVQFSRSVVSDCLRPHGLKHARLPCPSPTPGACSDSYPSCWWCQPTISSSVVSFSSCRQSFSASGSFPERQFFTSGDQSIGISASASVLPMNIQDWFPLGLVWLISLKSKGISNVFSNTTVQKHQFFGAQLSLWSNSHIHTWLLEKP